MCKYSKLICKQGNEWAIFWFLFHIRSLYSWRDTVGSPCFGSFYQCIHFLDDTFSGLCKKKTKALHQTILEWINYDGVGCPLVLECEGLLLPISGSGQLIIGGGWTLVPYSKLSENRDRVESWTIARAKYFNAVLEGVACDSTLLHSAVGFAIVLDVHTMYNQCACTMHTNNQWNTLQRSNKFGMGRDDLVYMVLYATFVSKQKFTS